MYSSVIYSKSSDHETIYARMKVIYGEQTEKNIIVAVVKLKVIQSASCTALRMNEYFVLVPAVLELS